MKKKGTRYDSRVHTEHKFSTIQPHHSNPTLIVVSLYEGETLITRRQFRDHEKGYHTAKLHAYPEVEELMQ